MPSRRFPYLHSARRRTALTQADVAALLELRTKGAISRHEREGVLPPLQVALMYEALYGVPIAKLFAGAMAESRELVRRRAAKLRDRLQRVGTDEVFARRQRSIASLASS